MTYKEIIYMCMDELKLTSDDALYNEEHILFLLNKYRTFILKQRYSDIRKEIPESNYLTICLDLIKVDAIPNIKCAGSYLRSKLKIPVLMKIGTPKIYPTDYFLGEITYISRERMRYVGHNKYLQNIIYAALGPDGYLYFKSSNPQHYLLEKVSATALFEKAEEATELLCLLESNAPCDIMDKEFPIEEALVPVITELIIKELTPAEYKPEDLENDASDDLSNIQQKSK